MQQRIHFSSHAKRRMAQRAITHDQVILVIKHAKKIYRQGMIFHVMRDKDFPKAIGAKQRGRLKRLVVVTSNDGSNTVITAYRASGALKKIRCKSKVLF